MLGFEIGVAALGLEEEGMDMNSSE